MYGWTPLLFAASHNQLPTVKSLVEHGADPTAASSHWKLTALHLAAGCYYLEEGERGENRRREMTDDPALVKYLIQQGADIIAPADQQIGPILAYENGERRMRAIYVERGDNLEPGIEYALDFAPHSFSIPKARVLLTHGADINATNSKGCTALHYLALCGFLHIVQFLIENGADFGATDKKGRTMVHWLRFIFRKPSYENGESIVSDFLISANIYDPSMEDQLDLANVFPLMRK